MLAGLAEPLMDQLGIPPRRANSGRGFFLKCMEDVNKTREMHCINGPVSIALKTLDKFENTGAFSFPRLCGRVLAAKLRDTKRMAEVADHLGWEGQKV